MGRRRALSVGLAVCAAGFATGVSDKGSSPNAGGPGADAEGRRAGERSVTERARATEIVSAPVRIADAATVRLLRPGDRIDVVASKTKNGSARIIARSVRVAQVPKSGDTVSGDGADGALIVVAVPRLTATALTEAAAESRLAVTLC